MSVLSLFLSGDGRMGSALRRLIDERDASSQGLQLAATLDDADVVVDYSHPDWTRSLLKRLDEHPRPVLIGTTGLGESIQGAARRLAERVPVMLAPNTGIGVQILRHLVAEAVRMAGPGWDVEVIELHHGRKLDAPSGTAWALFEEVSAVMDDREAVARGRDRAVTSRVGEVGARSDGEVGIQALRGGDVVGEHVVYLVGFGERIEIAHRAWDRATFARGGLRIARWLGSPGRPPGEYAPSDVLLG